MELRDLHCVMVKGQHMKTMDLQKFNLVKVSNKSVLLSCYNIREFKDTLLCLPTCYTCYGSTF